MSTLIYKFGTVKIKSLSPTQTFGEYMQTIFLNITLVNGMR